MTSSLCFRFLCCLTVCLTVFGFDGIENVEWTSLPQNSAVVKGHDLIIDCQVKVTVPPSSSSADINTVQYQWMLNGSPVSDKTSIFANHSLLVPKVNDDDLGTYTCWVSLSIESQGHGEVGNITATATVIEAFIEPFLIDPESQLLGQGKQLILTCVSGRSAPAIEVYWTRNGVMLVDGDQRTASFGNYDSLGLQQQKSMRFETTASYEMVGKYRCVAFNAFSGQHVYSQEADITFESTPSDLLPEIDWNLPEQLIISEGQQLVLSCNSQVSTEPVQTDWFMGRYLVDESKRVFVLPNTSLAFIPLSSRDRGIYKCRLTNSKGSTWSPEVRLVIAYLETQFQEDPQDTTAFYGEDVSLPCQPPASLPEAAVLWYKDFKVLDLAARSAQTEIVDGSLRLSSVSHSDQGQYYCVAINKVTQPSTRTSKVARLTIEGPPEMVEPPVGTKLLKGTLLNLVCKVVSTPTPSVSWSFEGRPIAATHRISIMDQGQQLWISNVGQEWNGVFTCRCQNKYGSISATATVTVIVPPSSLEAIGEITVTSGDSLSIECPILGVPQPSFQWFHNGSDIGVDAKVTSTHVKADRLIIDRVTSHHSGVYTCKGTNEGGVATSSGRVTVFVGPYLTLTPENAAVILGHSVSLECKAGGNPFPKIQWRFNNSLTFIPGVLSPNKLTFPNFNWSNVGSYTCKATNLVNSATHTATLKMLVPPNITQISHPESPVKAGRHLRLACQFTGIPTPSITWRYQGVAISQTLDGRVRFPSPSTLEIESAVLEDAGVYECEATSVAGVDKKAVTVAVYGPPNAPKLLQALPLSSQSVYLIWEASSHDQLNQAISGFRIFYRERTREEVEAYQVNLAPNVTSIEVFGLLPVTDYAFHVSAYNDVGLSRGSNVLTAVTLQSEPSSPANLRVEVVTADMAYLTWEMPSSPNGDIKKYQLRHKRKDSRADFKTINIASVMGPTQEFKLTSLRPFFEYTVQVRAATVYLGVEMWGNYSTPLNFRTAMSEPTLPPQNIKANVLDASSVTVTWEEIPDLTQNGPIRAYHIRCVDINNSTLIQTSTNASVRELILNGLHPWRQYSVLIRGQNPVDMGPESKPVIFTTLPIAPVTVPRNLTGKASSSTAILLTWKPLPQEVVTCEITSYKVQFKAQGSSEWNVLLIPSSNITFQVTDLFDWTFYVFKMAAFTNTVTPGLGPFTDPITVRTKEGESSPVTSLSYTAGTTTLTLKWKPSVDVKGVLTGYLILYWSMESESQEQITRLSFPKETTSTQLKNLLPDTLYNVSLSSVNRAGTGKMSVLLVRTNPPPPTTSVPNTTFTQEPLPTDITTDSADSLRQSDQTVSKKNVPAIVAGSLVGSVCLVLMTIFFCLKCKEYQRNKRLSYVIDYTTAEEGPREERDDAHSRAAFDPDTPHGSPNAKDDGYSVSIMSHNLGHTDTTPPHNASSNVQNSHHSVEITVTPPKDNYNNNTHSASGDDKYDNLKHDSSLDIVDDDQNNSVLRVDNGQVEGKENNNHSKKDSQIGAFRKKLSTLSRLPSLSSRYSKFDDKDYLASNMDGAEYTLPDSPTDLTSNTMDNYAKDPDTLSVMSDTLKRRTRMRTESAAAIATLRSSNDPSTEDRDISSDKEVTSEVIFNERTEL